MRGACVIYGPDVRVVVSEGGTRQMSEQQKIERVGSADWAAA